MLLFRLTAAAGQVRQHPDDPRVLLFGDFSLSDYCSRMRSVFGTLKRAGRPLTRGQVLEITEADLADSSCVQCVTSALDHLRHIGLAETFESEYVDPLHSEEVQELHARSDEPIVAEPAAV